MGYLPPPPPGRSPEQMKADWKELAFQGVVLLAGAAAMLGVLIWMVQTIGR